MSIPGPYARHVIRTTGHDCDQGKAWCRQQDIRALIRVHVGNHRSGFHMTVLDGPDRPSIDRESVVMNRMNSTRGNAICDDFQITVSIQIGESGCGIEMLFLENGKA